MRKEIFRPGIPSGGESSVDLSKAIAPIWIGRANQAWAMLPWPFGLGPKGLESIAEALACYLFSVISSFVVGAFVTPGPEISSQIAVSSALIALYFLSVGIAFIIQRKKKSEPQT